MVLLQVFMFKWPKCTSSYMQQLQPHPSKVHLFTYWQQRVGQRYLKVLCHAKFSFGVNNFFSGPAFTKTHKMWQCVNTNTSLPGFSQTTPLTLLLRVFPVRLHPLESRHFSSIGSTNPIRTEEFQTEALRCLIAKLFQLLRIQLLTSGISPIRARFKQRKYLKRHHWPAAVNPSNYSALSSRLCFIRAHLTWLKSCWSKQKVLKNWAGCLNDCEKEQESSFHFWTATVESELISCLGNRLFPCSCWGRRLVVIS